VIARIGLDDAAMAAGACGAVAAVVMEPEAALMALFSAGLIAFGYWRL
jgi:hypothetical protein